MRVASLMRCTNSSDWGIKNVVINNFRNCEARSPLQVRSAIEQVPGWDEAELVAEEDTRRTTVSNVQY